MFRRAFLAATAATFIAPALARAVQANTQTRTIEMDKKSSGLAPINGQELYYDVRGTGRPLIVLHGGLGAHDMFGPILDQLAATRQVIGVDLQGHGRTANTDRPMSYEAMADDIAKLAAYLKLDKPDLFGYSMGGGVALRAAIDHGEAFGRIVLVSTPYGQSGWTEANRQGMGQLGAAAAEAMKNTPMYQLYAAVAPRVEDWPVLLTKMGQFMGSDYDWSEEVKTITNPVMLVVGDADSVRLAHTAHFFELLGGGIADGGWDGSGMTRHRLAVLPGVTHYQIFMLPEMVELSVPFLDAKQA